jgi:hypothetical protein
VAAAAAAEKSRAFWVFSLYAEGAYGKVGYVELAESVGQAGIAAGTMQDPLREDGLSLKHIKYHEPAPPVQVVITGFTAANPTRCLCSTSDASKLANGNVMLVQATAGAPEAVEAIDGRTATVSAVNATPGSFALSLDLSAVDVVGLAAIAIRQP